MLTPARLGPVEEVGVGVQLRARTTRGTFSPSGDWSRLARGDVERTFDQALVASFRATRAAQASVLVPWVETQRTAAGTSESGGGLGDVSWTARYDFTEADEPGPWPGIAVLVGGNVPTGRGPNEAKKRLATDVTGTGLWDLSLGVALERLARPWFFALSGWLTRHLDREVMAAPFLEVSQSYATRFTALALVGLLLPRDMAVALYVNAFTEGNNRLADRVVPDSGLRLTTAGATWVWPFARQWRSQLSLFADIPGRGFGRNETASLGGTAAVLWTWP